MVAGLKVHVMPVEQDNVMVPVKAAGDDAETVKVAEVLPTGTVTVELVAARENTASPFPERVTLWGLPLALSLMLKAPLRTPLAVGWNETLIAQLCPMLSTFKVTPQVLVCTKSPPAVI
jgi:hypothetical protein